MYEIPPYGGLLNPKVRTINFLLNVYSFNPTLQVFDLIRFIVAILLFFMGIINFTSVYRENINQSKEFRKGLLGLVISSGFLFDLINFALLMIVLIMRVTTLNQDLDFISAPFKNEIPQLSQSFTLQSDYDLYRNANSFEFNCILECLNLIFLFPKILSVLCVWERFKIFVEYVTYCFKQIFTYYLIVLLILFSFALFANNLWGQYKEDYSDISVSITSTLLYSIGHFSYNLPRNFKLWNLFYVTMFFFVFIYFIMTSFVGIFIEAFRLNSLKYGSMYDERLLENK